MCACVRVCVCVRACVCMCICCVIEGSNLIFYFSSLPRCARYRRVRARAGLDCPSRRNALTSDPPESCVAVRWRFLTPQHLTATLQKVAAMAVLQQQQPCLRMLLRTHVRSSDLFGQQIRCDGGWKERDMRCVSANSLVSDLACTNPCLG